MTARYSCVLLTSDHEYLARPAEALASVLFDVRHASRHSRNERKVPDGAREAVAAGDVDFLLNFLSPMIVPASMLASVRRAAINFHPGPPEWPGVGAPSYAIYHGDKMFGATAHRMTSELDGGEIVRVVTFPVADGESCDALFNRALHYSLSQFFEVAFDLAREGTLQAAGFRWGRAAITRKQFDEWMQLLPGDSQDEIDRKIRALRHPRHPGPFMVIDGVRVDLSRREAR